MADTQIVCPICTVILGHIVSDLVDLWLACQTIKPEDLGRFPDVQLLYIFLYFFRVIKVIEVDLIWKYINDKKSLFGVLY